MRSHSIDEDVLRGVQAALDMIIVYKMLHDRKLLPTEYYDTNVAVTDDYAYYARYEFIEEAYGYMFGDYAEADFYIVNEPESEITADFPGVEDFYPYDEFPVNGIVINHPAIPMYIDLCDKCGVELSSTLFANEMYRIDMRFANMGSEGYYTEIFIPERKLIHKYNICIFYTDSEWFTSRFLEMYYDVIDYIMDVVTHPNFDKNMLFSKDGLGE